MNCPTCGGAQQALFLGRPRRGQIKTQILRTIATAGQLGLTVDELERLLSLGHQSVSARIHELWSAGEINHTGPNGRRQNPSGRKAFVWVIDPLAARRRMISEAIDACGTPQAHHAACPVFNGLACVCGASATQRTAAAPDAEGF